MKRVCIAGNEFSVEVAGDGPPLLLVHGFPLNYAMWSHQIDELRSSRLVISPDLRGFGGSALGSDVVTMETYADDLAAILDQLGVVEPVAVCGFSMGGYITFEFWRKYASRVHSLILCDTRASSDSPDVAHGRLEMAKRVVSEGHDPLVEGVIEKLLSPSTIANNPLLVNEVQLLMRSNSVQGVAAALRAMACRADSTSLLPHIDVPTTLLVGDDDVISTPAEMRQMASVITESRFVTIPLAGHLSPMENHDAVTSALLDQIIA